MYRNKELYEYFLDQSWRLTEDWYRNLEKNDLTGVYASLDSNVIATVKQQNHDFHLHFCEVFIKEEEAFYKDFEKWILNVAQDEEHLITPLQHIHREFFHTQEQYFDLIYEFTHLHKGKYSVEDINTWSRIVVKTFGNVMIWFTQEYMNHSQKRLKAQQELILELSSPVISLNKYVALLPLVGEIDTARAKIMLENTLDQCSSLGVNRLLLDLSGVVMIDTMVAQQLFQLIEALKLIGVETTLSGLRPEIAQTAVQLGLNFEKISITSTLSKAIASTNFSKIS
jgi:rsbT co-antagonist protein RsbR